ncbi:hypothetical protein E8E12_005702 [Didymella heteroderae]|uniref:Uncharacterized protein n=1 Tax=Didymella heteroderae TaxID=1769908 RepID=A0A9P5BXX6_9PLEO|nr:hypothetical protein E8E12_005702 [Didymella heteroderae]
MLVRILCLIAASARLVFGVPVSADGPQPGQSPYYSAYRGKVDAFPANVTKAAILATSHGAPGADDLLFQNLLSAEWAIYSFYQQGVSRFNTSAFVEAGFPNTTYGRIAEICDNEAGHLTIFQDAISSASVTPGACEYEFPYTDATSYLELGTLLEVSSMAFLTGLLLQAELDTSKATLVAVAETESRHNTWSLMDVWRASPFAGPADTVFPHANEILETTNLFIVPGSCPPEDPPYPSPNQKLPLMSNAGNETLEQPGSTISVSFPEKDNQPDFVIGERYYLVAFHGVANASSPFDIKTGTAVFPKDIEPHKGIVVLVIADCPGAPTLESVVAGPLILPQY